MPAGRKADPDYLRAVATAALISEATSAYNSARYDEALKLYASAAESLEGEQLRVLNGLYLTNWKLGRASEAERAFRRILSYGLSNNALAVKVLFRPGSTDFWPDPNVSGPYAIWMRQIAREASASRVCLNLVGHTSRTGSEQVNARLSQQRALVIKQRLETEAPELSARMRYSGVGWRKSRRHRDRRCARRAGPSGRVSRRRLRERGFVKLNGAGPHACAAARVFVRYRFS